MKKNFFIFLAFIFVSNTIIAQSQADVKKIIANYDMAKLKNTEDFYRKKQEADKRKAIAVALQKNWPLIIKNTDGNFSELMRLSPEGLPIYYSTQNVNAAKSTRANHLNTGGSLGLNLNGQGMVVREWDGGNVRTTHTAFGGRVTVIDDPTNATTVMHSTHVCGTMVASATPATVKGMAYQANARTFNWDLDDSEAISEAQLGMLISNHSYGVPITSNGTTLPSWLIGSYSSDAYIWDELAYNAPYYLAVMSAGNDGTNNDNLEPLLFGYDKLVSNKTAKNNLVVASCADVTVAADGTVNPANVSISSFSSQGPTDDFRVKPDITGNGENLTSTSNTSNTATAAISGTSMASPNVAGTLVLVQQHYKNFTNNFMRAATLKGLACHTADDAGDVGPDPNFGWGLLNAKKAVETINANGLTSWISEENLNTGRAFTMTVNSNGTAPLIASITWTDLPGAINNGTLPANDTTPALVNDLDIRITKNTTTYFPWRMNPDPSSPAIRTGDNSVDNVEQVKIDAPTAGQYTITVSSKGTLVTGSQKYSLIITGINSSFAINSTSDNLSVCANQNAVYTFNYSQTGSGATTFSAVDLPTGATASFSPTSLSAAGTVTMTISGLSNVIPNEYFVGIRGTNATETETRYKSLRIYNAAFQSIALQNPTNGQSGLSTTTDLTWNSQANAQSYSVQVSLSPNFTSFVINDVVTINEYNLSGLSQATRYYWRVIPSNNCGDGLAANATVYSFATGTLSCDQTFTATDYSNNVIGTTPNSEAYVPLTITGGYTIGDINVNMDITHTWIGDITVTLEGPASIGTPIITLLDIPCGANQNINCTMDDDGGVSACSGTPAITGNIAPVDALSSLNTLPADGEWILRVLDHNNEDGGTINNFSINLCRVENVLSVVTNPFLNSSVYPNPTKGIVNVAIPALTDKATIKLYDIQGRQILSKETSEVYTSFGIENLQDGLYLVNIENEQGSITKKIILRRN
ncbi:S8 family serine peptidase [Flavobacterium paronense]|uniref:S8 family serine peptidase n=1 Tax=Flavobacterium paronense TaxID=1392775 RepID=A0ABV5GEM2_9FLAO|nr:S8 family serine peptidase [Flavobacterium paronense]MDN3678360.1 S8 family serine peptidase [Flavobacterium paronense]